MMTTNGDDVTSGPDVLNQLDANMAARAKDGVATAIRKRKFYKQSTDQDVHWFPHGNDPDVLQECC